MWHYVSLLGRHRIFVKGVQTTFEECRKRGEQGGQPAAEAKQQRRETRSSMRPRTFSLNFRTKERERSPLWIWPLAWCSTPFLCTLTSKEASPDVRTDRSASLSSTAILI
ncbi:hypothetical protein PUN28_002712 [Cardiocondyla obscurior]|uniref:Uncharacterized protein n=1 Tax=Cardiocondyla obscurior TaxID=286306 RepID=A0AAW2GVP5_9HYME